MKAVDLTLGLLRLNDYFAVKHANAHELRYEQLVSKPKEEVEKLCEFLGVGYEEGMEQYGLHVNSSKSNMFYSMGSETRSCLRIKKHTKILLTTGKVY